MHVIVQFAVSITGNVQHLLAGKIQHLIVLKQEMPFFFSILIFMSSGNLMLSSVEHEKSCLTFRD